jgi:transposase InsO family protein
VLDDASDYCWSYFLKKKSDLSQTVRNLVKDLKVKHKKRVKFIRCDNAGENKAFEKECLKEGLGIQFEWTAPGTPQQNGRVERKFATLFGRVRAMFKAAGLDESKRKGLWPEGGATATLLENLACTPLKAIPAYGRMFESEHRQARCLRTFGEMAVVANHSDRNV